MRSVTGEARLRGARLIAVVAICRHRTDGRRKQSAYATAISTLSESVSRTQSSCSRNLHVDSSSCPESRSATHRVASCFSQIVRNAIMIGTPMNAPETPHRKLQKKIVNKITNGDI